MPNLTALAEKRPELLATATMPDGHIYGLPGISEMGYIDDDGTYIGIGAIPQFTSINKDGWRRLEWKCRQHSMNSTMYLLQF